MLFDGDLVDSQTVGLNSEGAGYVVFLKRVLEWAPLSGGCQSVGRAGG